jgi:hypothetical protein
MPFDNIVSYNPQRVVVVVMIVVTGIRHNEIPAELREKISKSVRFKNYDFGRKIGKYILCILFFRR